MLKEKRIQEAKQNVRNYLSEQLMKKEKFNDIVFETYLRNHQESLNVAEKLSADEDSSLWIVVTSYYSMFYMANAALYRLGYKIGHKISHKITADALIVFVKDKLKERILENYDQERSVALAISENLIESFDFERSKRSRFQYETTEKIKRNKADTSLKRAKEFGFELKKLILEL